MKYRYWLGLVVGFLVGLKVVSANVWAVEVVKIIPFGFGQAQQQDKWFRYRFKPGGQGVIKLAVISLDSEGVKGRVKVYGDGLGEVIEEVEVEIKGKGRQRVDLKVKIPDDWLEREYKGKLVVVNEKQETLAKEDIILQVGENLRFDYAVTDWKIENVKDGLLVSFEVENKGQVSLDRLQVAVEYKNKWWFGVGSQESFSVSMDLGVGKKGRVEKKIGLPRGLMGPVQVKIKVAAKEKEVVQTKEFFWVGWSRLLWIGGWGLMILVGIGVAFRLIFKGMAGIIYRYLKQKAKRVKKRKTKEGELVDLLKVDNYPQLLLDIRRIVREEMEINRRLMMAEIEKSVAIKMLADKTKKTAKETKRRKRR